MAEPTPTGVPPAETLTTSAYSRPAGTRDLPPEAAARRDRIETRLLDRFRRYGFSRVDVPMLEYRDLYSPSRIGPDLFHNLVLARLPTATTFPPDTPDEDSISSLSTHDAALRPDFTAPLARMLVTRLMADDGMRSELPARWSYAGSVFRARTPRPLRHIEFRQAGVELLGAAHPMADLEVLAMACDAADDLKVPDWRLHLGHAALFRALVALAQPRSPAARDALANGLVHASRMRTRVLLGDAGFTRYLEGSRQTLRQRVRDWLTVPGETADTARIDARMARDWSALVEPDALSLSDWRTRLPDLQERLLAEIWTRTHGVSDHHIDALLGLARSSGPPDAFFGAVARYVEAMSAHAPVELLDRVDRQLAAFHDLTRDLRAVTDSSLDLTVTPAASRGIAYYTGITFEIHTGATNTAYSAVCGGGRYSGLHRWLHNRAARTAALRRGDRGPVPALSRELTDTLTGVGFAFGVERLDAALREQQAVRARPDAYVVVRDTASVRPAFQAASRLRRAGLAVVCELPTARYTVRDLPAQLDSASKAGGRGARYALVFGTDEVRRDNVDLQDLDAQTARSLPLAEAEAWLCSSAARGVRP